MITNIYDTQEELVSTSISGGRAHFPHRLPEQAVMVYNYEIKYGENYHTLAGYIFGDDKFWWVLDDLNKPKKVFSIPVGTNIRLPERLVRVQSKKFY